MTAVHYGAVALLPEQPPTWQVTATPDVLTRLKRIFPRAYAHESGAVTLRNTDEVCRDLEWVLTRWPLHISRPDRRFLTSQADVNRGRETRVAEILSDSAAHMDLPVTPALPPRPYQLQAHALASASGGLLLADELGLGKTLSASLSLADPAMRPALVVTLAGQMERQWVNELAKFFPDLAVHTAKKKTPYPLDDREGREPDVIVMSYAKLSGWADHLAGRVRTVIFDEVQELRRDESAKYHAALRVTHDGPLTWGLSATPVYNYGGQMYNIINIVRRDVLGSRAEFAREWCSANWGMDEKTRTKDPEALRSHLTGQGLMLRRTRAEVGLQVPPTQVIEQFVDADLAAIKAGEAGSLEIARLILAKETERQHRWQAAGELDMRMRQATGVAKAPFVAGFVNLLLESEEKVLLLGWHRACYDIWLDMLSEHRPVMYTGSESTRQKEQAFEQFSTGDARVMIMSLRSGAGLDGLQRIDGLRVGVCGELDWSPGVHKQFIGRTHRPGQKHETTWYFCVSDHGADPVMIDILNLKQMEADLLVGTETSAFEQVEPARSGAALLAEQVLRRAGAAPATVTPAVTSTRVFEVRRSA